MAPPGRPRLSIGIQRSVTDNFREERGRGAGGGKREGGGSWKRNTAKRPLYLIHQPNAGKATQEHNVVTRRDVPASKNDQHPRRDSNLRFQVSLGNRMDVGIFRERREDDNMSALVPADRANLHGQHRHSSPSSSCIRLTGAGRIDSKVITSV
eukprot:764485-Hanusia_phi.AAC.1